MMLGTKNLMIACQLIISFVLFTSYAYTEDSQRSLFWVKNMSCGRCIAKIDAKLKTLDGYEGMLVNLDKCMVVVDHKQILTDSQIAEAVTSAGYPARAASETEYDNLAVLSSESSGWRSPSGGFLGWLLSKL